MTRCRFCAGVQVPSLHVLGGHRVPVPRAHRRPPKPQAVRVLVLRVPVELALGHHQAHPAQVGPTQWRRRRTLGRGRQLAHRRQGADDRRDGPPELQQVQPVPDGDGDGHIGRRGQGCRWRLRGRQGRDQPEVRGWRYRSEAEDHDHRQRPGADQGATGAAGADVEELQDRHDGDPEQPGQPGKTAATTAGVSASAAVDVGVRWRRQSEQNCVEMQKVLLQVIDGVTRRKVKCDGRHVLPPPRSVGGTFCYHNKH